MLYPGFVTCVELALLLCLLLVAVLRWIIGSAGPLTTTEQNDAVISKVHVTLEAVKTGFKGNLGCGQYLRR
jgi:hypothetical protein